MFRSVFVFLLIFSLNRCVAAELPGQQPNVSIDAKGTVRMVYGAGDRILYMTSKNNGQSFTKPVEVGRVSNMHLGHTRGPQIASSKNYSVITAIDEAGTIHSYKLNHVNNTWVKSAKVNDQAGSAVEGLMSVTADGEDNFYATWLDIRQEKKNNIFFSSMNGKANSWNKNVLVYKSPDGHTCECCKPNIAFNKGKLVVGFRNWLMGSRDIYYSVSNDKGKTFGTARKSGQGTWQLNACPMDGGGLAINEKGIVTTSWRRNSDVFYAAANQREQKVAVGKEVSMAQKNGKTVMAWQHNSEIQVMNLKDKRAITVGQGVSPKVCLLANGKVLCVWEEEKLVKYKVI